MVFNDTFNNISVISWWSILLVEEVVVPGENHWPAQITDKLYHIILYQVHLVWEGFELPTLVIISTDCIGNCKSNYHKITITTTSTGCFKERWDIFLNLVRRILFLCHAKVVTCIILFLQKRVGVLNNQMLDSTQGHRKTHPVIKRNNGQLRTKVYIVNIITIRLA